MFPAWSLRVLTRVFMGGFYANRLDGVRFCSRGAPARMGMALGRAAVVWICAAISVSGAESLSFERHVRPIFKAYCFHCHGESGIREGDLDLRLRRLAVEGGESGAAIVPEDPEASLLWRRVSSDEMPEGDKKLSASDKEIIRVWIANGATTERPEPDSPEDARFSFIELEHWAFQPMGDPEISSSSGVEYSNPIDAFIASRLEGIGLGLSGAADRSTWVRRVYFDVIGLPPTPREVARFVGDQSPRAEERLIDELLGSPQFGVRWARHWLDVAGYAESDGGVSDSKRKGAWRYRDYVVASLNANKPVDQFIREQLAGDELIEVAFDPENDRQAELLTATGFLRMAPDATSSENSLVERNNAVANSIQVVSSSLLGLTVGCAQCHDHKYDPITSKDYYEFRAIFDPAFPLKDWKRPNERLVDMTPAAVRKEYDRIEAKAAAIEADWQARREAVALRILEEKLALVPEELRGAARVAVNLPGGERTEEQNELLENYPMVKPIPSILGLLVEYDREAYDQFEKEKASFQSVRERLPIRRQLMATTESADKIPVSEVLFRGDPESPRERVSPGELDVLDRDVRIPVNASGLATTGRRLAYAKQLTDGSHPLTARVYVNRVWARYFGRGLVATPGDFGLNGARPSHPELLDWLAIYFVKSGWNEKALHRLILTSKTYRQRSTRTDELDALDPENIWLARMAIRRLDAEVLRDACLHVSGNLRLSLGGPSAPVNLNNEGKAVVGTQVFRNGIPIGLDAGATDARRRSLYIEATRGTPLNTLATFDQPTLDPNCHVRPETTVPLQALWFLNDTTLIGLSHEFARNLLETSDGAMDVALRALWMKAYSVSPFEAEVAEMKDFVSRLTEYYQNAENDNWRQEFASDPEAPKTWALASLCQVTLASNRFIYVD